MEIGEQIIIGGVGEQSLPISEPSVDPQHAKLKRLSEDEYQLEDMHSTKGTYVFGLRIKRKTVLADTPIVLGGFKTTVRQLLENNVTDLEQLWNEYNKEKQKWNRYSQMVNMMRILPTLIILPVLQMTIGFQNSPVVSMAIVGGVLVLSFILSDRVSKKQSERMAEMDAKMRLEYVCPRCHKFLGMIPYKILKSKVYCPHPDCGVRLP